MDAIEPDVLYDERGDVSWSRPLLQGDVFDDIVLPGFGDGAMKVQVINHPCAMQKGSALLPRITVAPVERNPLVQGGGGWGGNLRIMPLADLTEDGVNYASKFVDVTAARAELFSLDKRIATLSHRGIYVLQQRLIKHYTRFEVDLDLLRRESAPILEEAMIQWDWIETVLTEAAQTDEAAIDAEARVFDEWLSEGDPSRRNLLKEEVNHTDIRKQAQRASRERARDRG